jgi:hypothetical protein
MLDCIRLSAELFKNPEQWKDATVNLPSTMGLWRGP